MIKPVCFSNFRNGGLFQIWFKNEIKPRAEQNILKIDVISVSYFYVTAIVRILLILVFFNFQTSRKILDFGTSTFIACSHALQNVTDINIYSLSNFNSSSSRCIYFSQIKKYFMIRDCLNNFLTVIIKKKVFT